MSFIVKAVLEHPAASNGVCSRHRSGCNGIIKNRLFSFADVLLFLPDFTNFKAYVFQKVDELYL